MNKTTFDIKKNKIIKKTIINIQKKLEDQGIYKFKKEPSVKYTNIKNLFYLKICDEGKNNYSIIKERKTTKSENIVFNLYLKKEILDDDIWAESAYLCEEFTDTIIRHRERNISTVDAYTQNLNRINNLIEDKHFYASIVMIVSAFETAIKKLFFDNSEIWFFTLEGGFDWELANKYGSLEKKTGDRIAIHLGDEKYWFKDTDYEIYKSFLKIKNKSIVLQILKKIGLKDRYIEKLSCNNFEEIGFYEILKQLLNEEYQTSRLSFQKINGTGGAKWVMKNFFSIDLTIMNKELKSLEEIFNLRHRIIHGFIDDTGIEIEMIKKGKDNLKKVLLFLDHEINSWYTVIP